MDDRDDRLIDIGIFVIILMIVILKFTGVISLSWAVLLSPIWILFLTAGLTKAAILIIAIVKGLIDEYKERKNERNKNV